MTLDTNIIIAYIGGDANVIALLSSWRKEGKSFFLSTVAETEVLSFSEWTSEECRLTEKFIEENFTSIPFDRNVARIAADIRRSSKIKFPDAAIAATAIFTRTPVVTRDRRDFKRIPKLPVVII